MSEAVPQPANVLAWETRSELLLIRHGRSADVVPGSVESEDPPLHERGVQQAAALAERLRSKHIDAIYASNLRRAVETAQPLADQRGLEVVRLADLREVFLGEWERGEFRRRAAARDPEWVRAMESGRWDNVPGSEGDAAFRARVCNAVDTIAHRHQDQTVAVVCHGGVINVFLAALVGTERSHLVAIENTSITVVRGSPQARAVVAVNDCHHLYDPVLAAAPPS